MFVAVVHIRKKFYPVANRVIGEKPAATADCIVPSNRVSGTGEGRGNIIKVCCRKCRVGLFGRGETWRDAQMNFNLPV